MEKGFSKIISKYNSKQSKMKKKLTIVSALLISGITFSQLGINTSSPKATLDISAKIPTGTTTSPEGLLIPQISRERAQSMTGVALSTMIYVNEVSTGSQSGNAVNIDKVGYYYFNGSVWIRLSADTSKFVDKSIYTADGSLEANRTVTQGANTLAFTGNAVNAFSVDGSTLSVDAANDRLGVGTTAPEVKLHVEGSSILNAARTVSSTKNALDINIGQNGYSYGNRTDNFGINIASKSTVGTGPVARINFGDNNVTTAGSGKYLSFSVGNELNELMFLTSSNSGRVGIGTSAPTHKLHVNGTNPLRLQGLSAGNTSTDSLMVVDATGVVKRIGALGSLSMIPSAAIFRLETPQLNFLQTQTIGERQVVPMSLVKNTIPGMSFNAATSTITFPAGTYQMTFVYEALHNATGCTISSYFVDFPLNTGSTRIHSTASHIEGVVSNHGSTITYATTVPANRTWTITLGRGQSGNCAGAGMSLTAYSTQLLVYRMGD